MGDQFDLPSNAYSSVHLYLLPLSDTGRRTQSHSDLLLSLPEKWWRPLCAWSHEGNKRKRRRSTSSGHVGWVPSTAVQQLLTLLLLPFPLPGNGFLTEDMKAERRGAHSPVQVEAACPCQTSTRSRGCFLVMRCVHSCPFLRCSKWIFFTRSRCLQCRCFHMTYLFLLP